MDFYAIVDQVIAVLRQRQRVTYRALKRQFHLDDDYLEDVKAELIQGQRLAVDEEGAVLVWTGDARTAPTVSSTPVDAPVRAPLTYTPPYLAEKILTSRSALAPSARAAACVSSLRTLYPPWASSRFLLDSAIISASSAGNGTKRISSLRQSKKTA